MSFPAFFPIPRLRSCARAIAFSLGCCAGLSFAQTSVPVTSAPADRSWTGFRERVGLPIDYEYSGRRAVAPAAAAAAAAAAGAAPSYAEAYFSPGGAEAAIVRFIGSAKTTLRLSAYSFTSASVVEALLRAKKRGVSVVVVVDRKHNLGGDSEGTAKAKAKAALSALVNAGVEVRSNSQYAIHHDKFIVVDEAHVQTGSFNYSSAAAKSNSENVLLLWNNPAIAKQYSDHWVSRWVGGVDFKPAY